jgi:hypothetical protein
MHASARIDRNGWPGFAGTARTGAWAGAIRRAIAAATACLAAAILIVGFLALSLGLGYEAYSGVGPDRPPVPEAVPAPAPPPVPATIPS